MDPKWPLLIKNCKKKNGRERFTISLFFRKRSIFHLCNLKSTFSPMLRRFCCFFSRHMISSLLLSSSPPLSLLLFSPSPSVVSSLLLPLFVFYCGRYSLCFVLSLLLLLPLVAAAAAGALVARFGAEDHCSAVVTCTLLRGASRA